VKSATSALRLPFENPEVTVFDVASLGECFRTLSDKRHRRGIPYQLDVLLVLLAVAKLGGADQPSAIGDWLHTVRAKCSGSRCPCRFPSVAARGTRVLSLV